MEKGVNLLPSVPQGDFLPKEERSSRSKPTKLPTTTLTLHPDRTKHVHNSQCQRLKKKSSVFLDKIDIYYLSSRLDNIIKRKSKPKIEVAELLAFISSVQSINAVRPLSSEFLNKILSDLAEASDISEHSCFTNDSFTKIIAQIINKTL